VASLGEEWSGKFLFFFVSGHFYLPLMTCKKSWLVCVRIVHEKENCPFLFFLRFSPKLMNDLREVMA
jgi:hypothetical protein